MTHDPQLARLGLFDARVPRYTSYPTAPHFGTDIGPGDFAEMIAGHLDAPGDVLLLLAK